MMEQAIATYREEAAELLTELESSLLELEETPEDSELINRVFRAMHTIKGSGAMFGFDDIASFTHEVETVFDLVRNGKMQVTKPLLNLTLKSVDHISQLLEASKTGEAPDTDNGAQIVAGLKQLTPSSPSITKSAESAISETEKSDDEKHSQTFRIRFRPGRKILQCGTNPISLLNELRSLGECRVIAQLDDIPMLEELAPEECYIYWDIILTTTTGKDTINDVFIFVEDDSELKIDLIDGESAFDNEDGYKKLGDILVEKGDLSPVEMKKILGLQKRFGELLVEQGVVSPEKVQAALAEQKQVREVRQEKVAATESGASIRVPAEKLDQLINLVGELVTVQAHLSQVASVDRSSNIVSISEEVERLTNELRDTALNIRMLPIGSTFSKFKRLVRDLSQELGKEIELETFGADTELDKTVIEKLNDPLVHIIRNSIDHGIETPSERLAAGKSSRGIVTLGAEHSGDSVLVTIRDDGKGLDRGRIISKAVNSGLIQGDAELSDKEVFSLIFAPGFSTAEKVTSVSGRGVGMDVVKRGIESLRGIVDIESKAGEGSTITLKIPLTLAIIDSLLVKIGSTHYVLPLAEVEECIELSREDIRNSHGRDLVNIRGSIIPYISLREKLGIAGVSPDIEQIVVVNIKGNKTGFVVDNVVGEHQTVIKSLSSVYRKVTSVSGATILGDGSVALIMDLAALASDAVRSDIEISGRSVKL